MAATAYPGFREADVALRDGSTVHVRPIRSDDQDAVRGFLDGLSEESRAMRFFSPAVDLGAAARWSVDVDYADRDGLIACIGQPPRIIAHAGYIRLSEERAEVAFAIADDYQGHGLATLLLAHLAANAERHGIALFEAEVLPTNHRMAGVFRASGFPVRTRTEPGALIIELPTSLSAQALERFDRREQITAAAAVRSFLAAGSVAVLGASRERGTIGGEIFHNLLVTGFEGPVHPVNPAADVVQSVPAHRSLADVPAEVDLAIIAVPADAVLDAARSCATKGVKAIVVVSSGFAEAGEEGSRRQRDLLTICRAAGMRLVGPNCMGIMNTDPAVRLHGTFLPTFPPAGRIGVLAQGGALGQAVVDYMIDRGLGISSFASVGNKADISGNDLLQYWEVDAGTDLALLYLESFGNPRKFARAARRVARVKPVVAVKSGRTAAGARATISETGERLAASDIGVRALFGQAGVIRTDTLGEMLDVAALLSTQPAPEGDRVAIVTNAGGPGKLLADACSSRGLDVDPLPASVQARLREVLPAGALVGNPVDLTNAASARDYGRAVEAVGSCADVDAVIVVFIPPLETRTGDVAAAIRQAAGRLERPLPVLSVFMSRQGVPAELKGEGVSIPSFSFPEDAARALARAAAYGRWRRQPDGEVLEFADLRRDEAAGLIAAALEDGPRWLGRDEVANLFACYGLPLAATYPAADPREAGVKSEELGGRFAVKALAPARAHRRDPKSVRLGLEGGAPVEQAARELAAVMAADGEELEGFVIQPMVGSRQEMVVGVAHDPTFGPVVACGLEGTAVELLRDLAVRITPLTDRDAKEMLRSLAAFPLLDGYRGEPPLDVPAVEELLLRISALVEAHPEVAELDCSPVLVETTGAVVIDGRVRLEEAVPPPPVASRTPMP